MSKLNEKAIKIQGKDYVLVSDRVLYFNETYKKGMIETQLIPSQPNTYIIKAKVVPDMDNHTRYFTGYSQATIGQGMVNKTAALENAETSAVGRALGFMGIGVIDSIASPDEINKAQAPIQKTLGKCYKCGADNAMSQKTGKAYCSKLCWKNPTPQPDMETSSGEEFIEDLPF